MPSSMRKAAGWTSRTRGRRPMLYGSVGPRPRKDYSCKINGRAASNHPASTYINFMKTLYELERSSCRWPIADLTLPGRRPGSQHLYCGKPAAPGKPYCREHAARAFQPLSLQNRGRRPRQGRAQVASWSASKPKAANLFRSLGGFAARVLDYVKAQHRPWCRDRPFGGSNDGRGMRMIGAVRIARADGRRLVAKEIPWRR
jgi:hypothetical protein